jgi:hypothetical protein
MAAETSCSASGDACSAAATLSLRELPSRERAGSVERKHGLVSFEVRRGESEDHGESRTLWEGLASRSGELLALLEPGRGHRGLNLMTLVGRGLSSTSVAGTYNAVALEEFFSTDAGVRNAFVSGPITFDGAQAWQFLGTDTASKRTECAGEAGCPRAAITFRSVMGGAGGSYTIGSTGEMSLSGTAGDGTPRVFVGNASSDGSVIVLRRVGDESPCSFDCSGHESFRSLIVAVRQ